MPGAYAHITLVNQLKEPRRLEAIAGFPREVIPIILDWFKFCELGAVSPDYPYLALGDSDSAKWADAMHYVRTGEMIHAGIRRLRTLSAPERDKGLVWLLGYAAHVVTDVTIHPVVELKVGQYEKNKTDHRICEVNQDTHIFPRLNLGGIGLSEYLDSGVCACGEPDARRLDPTIHNLWIGMMADIHPGEVASNPPNPDKWHRSFKKVLDDLVEEGYKLFPLARHVVAGVVGATYPEKADRQYIDSLSTPTGKMHYDQIFDKAIKHVGEIWALVASGVLTGDNACFEKIGNWNLDTGKDSSGKLVFWS